MTYEDKLRRANRHCPDNLLCVNALKIEFIIEFIADQDDFRVRIGEMRLPKRIIQIITVTLMNENQRYFHDNFL